MNSWPAMARRTVTADHRRKILGYIAEVGMVGVNIGVAAPMAFSVRRLEAVFLRRPPRARQG